MPLREQPGVPRDFVLRAHRSDVQTASQHRVGTSNGIHPEDYPYQTDERRPPKRQLVYYDDDDALYETRVPTSTRRYTPAPATTPAQRTIMRVTRHQGSPPTARASRTYAPALVYQEPEPISAPPEKRRVHVLVYVGVTLFCMWVGWVALTSLLQWVQLQRDTLQYGMPRTFQMDADVRHGGMSHFTVENLNGHILIYEVKLSDLTRPRLYLGPVFSGAGASMQPATIAFRDINGDGYPDMVIAVDNGRYMLINDHNGFRAVNSFDHISGKGV